MKRFASLLALCLSVATAVQAQSDQPTLTPELKALYGDITPGKSVPFNSVLTSSLILRDTKPEEWPGIREKLYKRITDTWGTPPVPYQPQKNRFQETGRYVNLGMTHIRYRYHVLDSIWIEAVCVLPPNFNERAQYPVVLTVHGTNGKQGKEGALGNPRNRAYAIELARRGIITLSPDLYGYGATIQTVSEEALYKAFFAKSPNWSLRGIRMLSLMRAVDMLEQLPFVKKGEYGAMGNSLGGGSVVYHMALDRRIKSAVVSTGVSPAYTNAYRITARGRLDEPKRAEQIAQNGVPPYDQHELIALCAPRAVLFLEPFNDPYNPDVLASFKAIYDASAVYKLLGTPDRVSILTHGDGHDTIDSVRDYAYGWLERFLAVSKPRD